MNASCRLYAALALLLFGVCGNAAAQCEGGEVYDDGSGEGSIGAGASGPTVRSNTVWQLFIPGACEDNPPADYVFHYTRLCASMEASITSPGISIRWVENDGGVPGDVIASLNTTCQSGFRTYDISSLGVEADCNGVFLSIHMPANIIGSRVRFDKNPETPQQIGYGVSYAAGRVPMTLISPEFRAFLMRAAGPESVSEGEGVVEGSGEGMTEGAVEGVIEAGALPEAEVMEGGVEGIPVEGAVEGAVGEGGGFEGGAEGGIEGAVEGAAEGVQEEGTTDGANDGEVEGTAEAGAEGIVEGEVIAEGLFEGVQEGTSEAALDDEGEVPIDLAALARLALLAWASMDANSNGAVADAEWSSHFVLNESLASLDLNGDLELSVAELQQLTEGDSPIHSADTNADGVIDFAEVLRVIQIYAAGSYACAADASSTEDGYLVASGDASPPSCVAHASDFQGAPDGIVSLSELLRLVQLYTLGEINSCVESAEDGFCALP